MSKGTGATFDELAQLLHDKGIAKATGKNDPSDDSELSLAHLLPAEIYSHEALINYMVANQGLSHAKLASHFGKTKGWLSSVLASDSFQSALDPRRHEVADPTITATMEERFRSLTLRSLSVLHDKLDSPECSDLVVLKAAEIGVKALGMGQAQQAAPVVAAPVGVENLAERLVAALEKQRRNIRRENAPEVEFVEVVEAKAKEQN